MNTPTKLSLHPAWTIDTVSPLIFGGFLEHMGRAVYQGVYDPDSSQADEFGVRQDVIAALQELQMTIMRYPGGNFASGYHWRDGVGPKQARPTVRELAWQSIEPNQFGTDEFLHLCQRVGWEPMLCANLGTGTPEEARDWVEYCNAPMGTRWTNLRADNGNPEPYGVKYWCLGNEMDGPWQLGHVPADHYAIRAQQAAKMMKDCDPGVSLIACGSCNIDLPSYLEWDRVVLEHLGGLGHYVSLHRYARNDSDDPADFLAMGKSIDDQIEGLDALCKYVAAKQRRRRRAYLCFDEWNVWYKAGLPQGIGGGVFAPPLIEEVYNLEDALVVASFLMSFIRHADSVKIANLAQVVNVIAPLLTRGDDLLKQSIFYAFEMVSKRKAGTAMRVSVQGGELHSPGYGVCDEVDCAAILDAGARQLHLFAMNRNTTREIDLHVELLGQELREVSSEILTGTDLKAANGFEDRDVIRSQPAQLWQNQAMKLPAHSFAATTFDIA